jgi:hypothetical protein
MPAHPMLGFGPSNCLFRVSGALKLFVVGLRSLDFFFRVSSTLKLFEAGLRSLELSFSGQQYPQVIRGRAAVPRIVFFGPAVPSSYSRSGFGPANRLFRASSAFKLFEVGLRSLELFFTV